MGEARRYRIPAARSRVEDRVEHSLFIGTVELAASVDAAKAAVERIRAEFADATHHCYAWVIGAPGSTVNTAASDDGEPAGTAGRPMLKVLLNSGVGDVVAIVTRYYGGVKLGKEAWFAYSGSVQHALRELKTGDHVDEVDVRITVPYAGVDAGSERCSVREDASPRPFHECRASGPHSRRPRRRDRACACRCHQRCCAHRAMIAAASILVTFRV
jgi:uncharacterized YigZ family protein